MNKISILLLLLFCTSLNAQKGRLFMSIWNESADAGINLPSDKYTFFNKGKLYYYISNNSDNIFVSIKVDDSGVQNRILTQGLTIWINMDSKTVKKSGIRFPIGSQYSGGRNRQNMAGGAFDNDGKPITPLGMANTIELVGFNSEDSRRFPAENADTFNGSVKYNDEGVLIYSMVLPIAKLPLRNDKEGDGTMPFIIGIEYGAPPVAGPGANAGQRASSGPTSGMSQGGGGGGRSGGGGSGRRPGGSGPPSGSVNSPEIIPPVITWIKDIKLAGSK